jgi:hypothetical protein
MSKSTKPTVQATQKEETPKNAAESTASVPVEEPKPNPYVNATDGTRVIALDPWLEPYAQTLRDRCDSLLPFFIVLWFCYFGVLILSRMFFSPLCLSGLSSSFTG